MQEALVDKNPNLSNLWLAELAIYNASSETLQSIPDEIYIQVQRVW